MATRFNETVNIRQVDSRSGGVEAALSLSDRLESFKQQSLRVLQEQAVQRGIESAGQTELTKAEVGGQQVTQAPTEKKENIFGVGEIETQAHNKSLRAAYLASLDSDNRNAVANIAAENEENITGFNDAIAAYRAGVLEGVDPSVRQAVQIDLDDKIESVRGKVHRATIAKQRKDNDETLVLGTERSVQDALVLASEGDALGSAESLLSAFKTIDARVESGLLHPDAAREQKRSIEIEATVENIRFTLKDRIERKGVLGGVDLINMAEDKKLAGFTVQEKDSLIDVMRADLNQHIQLENLAEAQQDDNLKLMQGAKFDDLYAGVLSGETTASDVQSAFRQKGINAEQTSKLINIFRTRGQGVDDWSLIRDIQEQAITDPEGVREAIMNNTGSRLTENTANELYAKTFEIEKTGSLLTMPDTKRFKTFLKNSVKVVGPMGAIDFDSQKRLAQLEVVYDERVLAGESPAIVARDLVDVNSFLSAPNPIYGTKETLNDSLNQLNNAFDNGAISDIDYNREYQNIQDLMEQKTNIDGFNKALKEALKQ